MTPVCGIEGALLVLDVVQVHSAIEARQALSDGNDKCCPKAIMRR